MNMLPLTVGPGRRPGRFGDLGAQSRAQRDPGLEPARHQRRAGRPDSVAVALGRPSRASCRATAAGRWRRTSARSSAAAPRRPRVTRTIAAARSSGEADGATKPLTPVLDQLDGGVVRRRRTTTLGVPARGRLDDDQPVALAPRRAAPGTARARSAVLDLARRRRSPGASTTSVEPVRARSPPAPPRARARRRRSRRAGPGTRSRARRDRRDERRRALLGDVAPGEHDERLGRRAARGGVGAARVLALEHRRRRRAGPPRAAARACRREKQNARCGSAHAQPLHRPADPPADAARGTRASTRASRPRASRRRAGSAPSGRASRGREQREVRERGRVHDVVAAAVAQQVPQHAARRSASGGTIRRLPSAA